MECFFRNISLISDRLILQYEILTKAVGNGLKIESNILLRALGQYNGLKGLNISTLHTLLLCSHTNFDIIHWNRKSNPTTFHLVVVLKAVISLIFFWPDNKLIMLLETVMSFSLPQIEILNIKSLDFKIWTCSVELTRP